MSECEDVGNLRSKVSPWKDPGALCKSFSPLSKLFLKVWRACVMFPSKWLHACICRVKGNLNAWRNPSAHRVMCNESKGNKSKLRDSLTRYTSGEQDALLLMVHLNSAWGFVVSKIAAWGGALHSSRTIKANESCFLCLYELPLCPADGVIWDFLWVSAFRSSSLGLVS